MPTLPQLILTATIAFLALFCAENASARGGGANLMMSPGYQRALEESRKRYRQEAQPYTQPPSVYPRKKWRHRGQR